MVDGIVETVMADSQTQNSNQAASEPSEDEDTESGVASTMTFKATIEPDWKWTGPPEKSMGIFMK